LQLQRRVFSAQYGDQSHKGEQRSRLMKKRRRGEVGSKKRGSTGALRSPGYDESSDADAATPIVRPQESDEENSHLPSFVLDSILKVFSTHCTPNYSLPWQMRKQEYSTSSGFIIDGNRILTNAHSVENFTVVRVKKRGSAEKVTARVVAIGDECDIALLTVDDPTFFEDTCPLSLGSLPQLQDRVTVVGYPIGGESISVTEGVVSRIEIQQYAHGATELLSVQIDAAINPGNSGGPALNARLECIGIAFQSLSAREAENVGYVIPTPVVNHFLTDVQRNGRYTGFCSAGIDWQALENSALRRFLGMDASETGVLLRRIHPLSGATAVLQKNDVLLEFEGNRIGNDGTVQFRKNERINFNFLVKEKYVGDECDLRILRGKTRLDVRYKLDESSSSQLVPVHEKRRQPEYLVVAGLVFVVLTEPYLRSEYGERFEFEAPVKLLNKLMHGEKKFPNEQVVILSHVIHHEITTGYQSLNNLQLLRFNDIEVRNLAHLAELVSKFEGVFMRFHLDYEELVVVETETSRRCTAEILTQHCIPSDRSIRCEEEVSEVDQISMAEVRRLAEQSERAEASAAADVSSKAKQSDQTKEEPTEEAEAEGRSPSRRAPRRGRRTGLRHVTDEP
jgi:S1-C subfamily serine protease